MTSGLYSFENMKKKIFNLTCLVFINILGALVLNNILRNFAKSICIERTHQESQIYCSSQKLAALHCINTILTALAGGKEETSKSVLLYLFGRGHKFL